jgi:hypothetical protein
MSGLSPIVIGTSRDLTGGFDAAAWLLLLDAVVLVAFCARMVSNERRQPQANEPAAASSTQSAM